MDSLVNQIARIVRFHRKKAKLTQLDLAKLIDIGKTSVFDIEKGKKTVRLSTLLAVLDALNVKVHFQSPLMHKFEEYEKS